VMREMPSSVFFRLSGHDRYARSKKIRSLNAIDLKPEAQAKERQETSPRPGATFGDRSFLVNR
jgi:hypothetical protein